MPQDTPEPTEEQQMQCTLASHEFAETMNRLGREGFPWPVILAGMASATADLITCQLGFDKVPIWFAKQSLSSWGMLDDDKGLEQG